jgi:homoserine dehydrogenase
MKIINNNKNINIAIVGLGQVGIYLYNELRFKKKDIEIKTGRKINIVAISAKNINKKRRFKIDKKIFFKNPLEIFKNTKIDILFEVIGMSDGISKKIVETALKNKIHVITANKALISKHGDSLSKLAELNNVNLEFEATVAGGIPILRTIKEGLVTNKINKVYGILNGTTNYILTEMEKTNESFHKVLKKAQKLGYAEPENPKLDLNGFDAFAKVRILSALAFNNQISKYKCIMEGIENINLKDIKIVSKLNLRIKLLGISEIINNQLFESVHPCLVSKSSYIGNVNGVMNAVITHGKPVGESILQGEGAGPGPTSSSLLSDLLSILRGNVKKPFGISSKIRGKISPFNSNNYTNSLYLRFEVKDKPGVLSRITNRLAKYKISVKRLIQTPDKKNNKATIVIITHKTNELNSKNCLSIFKKDRDILNYPTLIRMYN